MDVRGGHYPHLQVRHSRLPPGLSNRQNFSFSIDRPPPANILDEQLLTVPSLRLCILMLDSTP
jgi:hypothetical protein